MVTVHTLKLLALLILTALVLLALSCSNEDNPVIPKNQPPTEPVIDAPSGSPSHDADNASLTPRLRWKCSDPDQDKLTYDVYFGRPSTPPIASANQSATSFSPDTLNFGKRYYWKIIAKDEHGATTVSETWNFTTISDPTETINTPSMPTGLDSGLVNQTLDLSTGSSSSSQGHSIEYQFDWNDGNYSGWSAPTNASHSWSTAGTYSVAARARCTTHTGTTSNWSTPKTVVIAGPDSPVLRINPISLDFGSSQTSKTLTIENTGTGTLTWCIVSA